MQTQVYITRHGETEYNRLRKLQGRGIDAPLNKLGKRQAVALANYFDDLKLDGIYSSTLKRARQTAGYIAERHRMPVVTFSDLEEMGYGRYEGAEYKDVARDLKKIQSDWKEGDTDLVIEGGESPIQVLRRTEAKIHDILMMNRGAAILFVLHGRVIRILLSQWLRGGLQFMHTIQHANCAINHLVWENNQFRAVYLNQTAHLCHLENGQL